MDETMYESRDACPWYQSEDLDWEAAQAAVERERERLGQMAASYANYVAEQAEGEEGAWESLVDAGTDRPAWPY